MILIVRTSGSVDASRIIWRNGSILSYGNERRTSLRFTCAITFPSESIAGGCGVNGSWISARFMDSGSLSAMAKMNPSFMGIFVRKMHSGVILNRSQKYFSISLLRVCAVSRRTTAIRRRLFSVSCMIFRKSSLSANASSSGETSAFLVTQI